MTTTVREPAAANIDTPRTFTHRQILEILVGLITAMFVANLSGTIASNALPTISASLDGTQLQYMWVVTASLLASTATTPIWGKLGDLFDQKRLLQSGLVVFIVGCVLCGIASSMLGLIGARVVQGVGFGAIMALVQTILGTVIPPRQRGRYAAYTGAATALATVCGPLVGGFIVDQSWLSWRWCFFLMIPFAIGAMIMLQLRLKVPHLRRADTRIDWLGSLLLIVGVSLVLLWITFAGHEFDWISWQTAAMLGAALVSLIVFVIVEYRVPQPIIPMDLLTERSIALAIVASVAVGIALYGVSVFLGQYYQIGRGYSPTAAGLMIVPMMVGVLISSLSIGRWVSRIGKWKPFVLVGSILLTISMLLLSVIDHSSSGVYIMLATALGGFGVGMTMQNLVLAVQNSVPVSRVGAASGMVTFFRSLGGAIGIQVLGAIFARNVSSHIASLACADPASAHCQALAAQSADAGGESMDFSALPQWAVSIIRQAYSDSIGRIFLISACVCVVTIVAVVFMKATTLRDSFDYGDQAKVEAAIASVRDKEN